MEKVEAEMKTFRCLLGVSGMDSTRNESIRGAAQSPRGSDCLHMCRGERVDMMELPGRRRRGRAQRALMDGGRQMIRWGDIDNERRTGL